MDIALEKKIKRTLKRAKIYMLVAFVILGVSAYYSFTQYLNFREMQSALQTGQKLLSALQVEAGDLKTEYNFAKDEYLLKQTSRAEEISAVFPKNEAIHTLTTSLEKYFIDNNTGNNRIFLTSVDYAPPTAPKTADKQPADYMVLPITLSIESSQDNFMKFLKYLENSGSFEGKTRLMSLQSISFTVPEEKKEDAETAPGTKTLSFTLKINAYFQKGV
ncbi:hypothetical protein HZA41_01945 [Candidatus Peregrinibacteria bacterium]|nr:hypothetical protein [Candidatus Peregrinibacteria bacterium]